MAGRERDWMDYAQLGSSLAHNAQLSSIGDQLAALKQAESQKQFAEFEVTVIRQILFRIEDRIRFFTKQPSFSPQGRMLALMKLAEVLAAFKEPSFYRNYEDKDRHTALTTKLDEAVMEIARSLPPAELAEFNEAMAWRKKLPLLAKAVQFSSDTKDFLKQMEERPRLESEYQKAKEEWQTTFDAVKPELMALEAELKTINAELSEDAQLKEASNGTKPYEEFSVASNLGCCVLVLLLVVGGVAAYSEKVGIIAGVMWAVWCPLVVYHAHKVNKLRRRGAPLLAKISSIKATLPPEPNLPPPPAQPVDESCERFLRDEKLGSTFLELEAAFIEKRVLVERVLESDAALSTELTDLDARALLHRTAQEVATKMGLPLPPQIASGASA